MAKDVPMARVTNPGLVTIRSTGTLDGILRTFDLFTAYNPGYFVVDIMASDLVGHNDTAIVGIYILRDDQRVKIIINEIPDKVRQFEEEFISLLSNITGAIVNTDDVQVTIYLGGCFERWITFHVLFGRSPSREFCLDNHRHPWALKVTDAPQAGVY